MGPVLLSYSVESQRTKGWCLVPSSEWMLWAHRLARFVKPPVLRLLEHRFFQQLLQEELIQAQRSLELPEHVVHAELKQAYADLRVRLGWGVVMVGWV